MQELRDNLLKALRLALTNIKIYPSTSLIGYLKKYLKKSWIAQLDELLKEK